MRGLTPAAPNTRMREAALFRAVGANLRQVRPGQDILDVTLQQRALADAKRLWLAVGAAVARPDCALPEALRLNFSRLGLAVLKELRQPEPDLELLIRLNEQVADGLAPRQGWEAAMLADGGHVPLET